MAMSSCNIFLLLFVRFNVCYGLYPSYQSEAASAPPAITSGSQGKGGISSGSIVALVVSISVAVLIFLVGICCLSKRKRKSYDSEGIWKDLHDIQESYDPYSEGKSSSYISKWAPPQYDFITIETATNKFSSDNLIDKFRREMVYRGMLPNGQEIAVKRFERRSSLETVEAFNNELEVYAKLQHRNVAGPVGFSVQGDEKILVYEYSSNQSLHENLSNYIVDGKVSGKDDVYSFGILLMEIISGKLCYPGDEEEGTPGSLKDYAWHLWMEGQALELLDPTIRESYNHNEVMRCIHIAMLCFQLYGADRHSMASVVLMIENHPMILPSPSPPHPLSF